MIYKTEFKIQNPIEQEKITENTFTNELLNLIPGSIDDIRDNMGFVARYTVEEVQDFLTKIKCDHRYIKLIIENNLPHVFYDYIQNSGVYLDQDTINQFLNTQASKYYSNGSPLKIREVQNSRLIYEVVAESLLRKYVQKRVPKILEMYKSTFPKLGNYLEALLKKRPFDIELNFTPDKKDNGGFHDRVSQKIFNVWFGFSDKTDLDKSYGPFNTSYLYNRKSIIDLILAHEMIHVLQILSEITARKNTFIEHSFREGLAVYFELFLIQKLIKGEKNILRLNIDDCKVWRKQRLNSIHKKDKTILDEYADGAFKTNCIIKNFKFSTKDLNITNLEMLYKQFIS